MNLNNTFIYNYYKTLPNEEKFILTYSSENNPKSNYVTLNNKDLEGADIYAYELLYVENHELLIALAPYKLGLIPPEEMLLHIKDLPYENKLKFFSGCYHFLNKTKYSQFYKTIETIYEENHNFPFMCSKFVENLEKEIRLYLEECITKRIFRKEDLIDYSDMNNFLSHSYDTLYQGMKNKNINLPYDEEVDKILNNKNKNFTISSIGKRLFSFVYAENNIEKMYHYRYLVAVANWIKSGVKYVKQKNFKESTIGLIESLMLLENINEDNLSIVDNTIELEDGETVELDESVNIVLEYGIENDTLLESILKSDNVNKFIMDNKSYADFQKINESIKNFTIFDTNIKSNKVLEVTLDNIPVGYIYESINNKGIYFENQYGMKRIATKGNIFGTFNENTLFELMYPKVDYYLVEGEFKRKISKIGKKVVNAVSKASNVVDENFRAVMKFIKDLYLGGRSTREEIIIDAGPSVAKMIKLTLVHIGLWGITPALSIISAIVVVCLNKRIRMKERNKLLRELKNELEIVEEKIKDADSAGDRKAKYQLMRIRQTLTTEIERIRYKWARDEGKNLHDVGGGRDD